MVAVLKFIETAFQMSLLAAFQTHADLPQELIEICGADQFFERNMCLITEDIKRAFGAGGDDADAEVRSAVAALSRRVGAKKQELREVQEARNKAYQDQILETVEGENAGVEQVEAEAEEAAEAAEAASSEYRTPRAIRARAVFERIQTRRKRARDLLEIWDGRLERIQNEIRDMEAGVDDTGGAAAGRLGDARFASPVLNVLRPSIRTEDRGGVYSRIRTELFSTMDGVMHTLNSRISKMGGIDVRDLDSDQLGTMLPTVVRQKYLEQRPDLKVDGFYWSDSLLYYCMGGEANNDCRWTPLLLHINFPVDTKWSLHVFWNACIARTMSDKALMVERRYITQVKKTPDRDRPFEESIVVDLLPFTDSPEIPGSPAKGEMDAEIKSLLDDRAALKAWGEKRPLEHPDLGGIQKGDIDEIWSRATNDDSSENTVKANETLMLIEDAIKEYLYQTPPYQVAARVAGFNSSQVSQLYYERVFTDVVDVFQGESTLKKMKQVSDGIQKETRQTSKKRKRTFDTITSELSPDELRSGMVPQAKIYRLLRALFRTPEWRARIHWRPSLHSHYFDVLQFVEHRLKAVKGPQNLIDHLRAEINQRSTALYGARLFRSRCAEIDAGMEWTARGRVESRERGRDVSGRRSGG